jgi:hypothetical protein
MPVTWNTAGREYLRSLCEASDKDVEEGLSSWMLHHLTTGMNIYFFPHGKDGEACCSCGRVTTHGAFLCNKICEEINKNLTYYGRRYAIPASGNTPISPKQQELRNHAKLS